MYADPTPMNADKGTREFRVQACSIPNRICGFSSAFIGVGSAFIGVSKDSRWRIQSVDATPLI